MRLREWERALRHFRRALAIDPHFKTALDNILEMRAYNLPAGYQYNDSLGIEVEDRFIQVTFHQLSFYFYLHSKIT